MRRRADDRAWQDRGNCKGMEEPDIMFAEGKKQNRARKICVGCEVRSECLATALTEPIQYGVWGGMTDRERRALLRRGKHVDDWWSLLVEDKAVSA